MSHSQAKTPLRVTIIGYAISRLGRFGRVGNEEQLLMTSLVLVLEVWQPQSHLDFRVIKSPCLSLHQRYALTSSYLRRQPY